jgi:hypothetical protein
MSRLRALSFGESGTNVGPLNAVLDHFAQAACVGFVMLAGDGDNWPSGTRFASKIPSRASCDRGGSVPA